MKIKKLLTFFAVAALMVSCGDKPGTEPTDTPIPTPPPAPDKILAELPDDPQATKFDNFTRRVMILDHTGQGCGVCPSVTKILESISKNPKHNDKVVIVAAHNFSGGDDMKSTIAMKARTTFSKKISGYSPALTYDHRTDDEYCQVGSGGTVTTFMARADKIIKNFPAKAGISATVKEDGDNIVVYTGIKVAEDAPFTIGLWILEDGEVNWQNGASNNYVHNDILRGAKNNNDVYGDALDPNGDKKRIFKKGETVGSTFTIKKPKELKDISKTRVAIFLCTPDKAGATTSYINNIIQCPVGESVPFSYTE